MNCIVLALHACMAEVTGPQTTSETLGMEKHSIQNVFKTGLQST